MGEVNLSGGLRAAVSRVSHVALWSAAQLWLVTESCTAPSPRVQIPVGSAVGVLVPLASSPDCRVEAALGLFSSQLAGSRTDCAILDLHSETTAHWATRPWCPCPQFGVELDYL